MDHGDAGNARYTGVGAATVTGDMVLLGLFVACGISAPVRIEHERGAAGWVLGTLKVPRIQGH